MYLTKEVKADIFAKHGEQHLTQVLQKDKLPFFHTELVI